MRWRWPPENVVGVAVGVLPHQAHVVQQFIDPLAPLLLGGEFGVKIQRLPDDVHDRHTGVQGGIGILKDHLDTLAVGEQLGAVRWLISVPS